MLLPNSTTNAPAKAQLWSGQDRPAAWLWNWRFESEYDRTSHHNAKTRAVRRARARERHMLRADIDQSGTAVWTVRPAGARRNRKCELVYERLTTGFQWSGGSFAGNPRYVRQAFRQAGLISEQHLILKLFVTKLPKAHNLYIGDTKGEHYTSDSKLLALDAAYVEANKVMCGVVRIEVDAALSAPAIEIACRNAGVPCPNIVVGWKDRQGDYVNPHLIWLLDASVPLANGTRSRFRSLYRGVLRGLTKALLPIGADPGGLFNSHRHKNPLSPLWDRQILAEQPYSLRFIAEHVDITVRLSELDRMVDLSCAGCAKAPLRDHPNDDVMLGSNRVFRRLALWARTVVTQHRAHGGDERSFAATVAAEACRLVLELSGDPVQQGNLALGTAAALAAWTWNIYRAPKRQAKLSATEITQRESDGARQTAAKRSAKTQGIIIAAATVLFAQSGKMPTQVAVLVAIQNAGIRSEKTVRNYWPVVLAALRTGNLPPLYVKKTAADGPRSPMAPPSPGNVPDPSQSRSKPRVQHDNGVGTLPAEIDRSQKPPGDAECTAPGHGSHRAPCGLRRPVPSPPGLTATARQLTAAGGHHQPPTSLADPSLAIHRTSVARVGACARDTS